MSETAAIETAQSFVRAFSARDHDALAATLNYPHVRLARGRFFEWASAEAFAKQSRKVDEQLIAERFDHSELRRVESIHGADTKVHLAIINDRVNLDGDVYMTFNTLWIATLQDDHWGIQFRSSYL